MWIKEVKIYGFGKWHDQSFKLNESLQVFYGENEAGKSTLSAFIKGVLFGFADGHNKYEQYIPKNESQYGGQLTLVTDDKKELVIRRVNGKKGGQVTVIDQDETYDESYLTQLLLPANRELFEAVFMTNQSDLNAIFNLNPEDFQNHLLNIGAVGSHQWLNLRDQLTKFAGQLYKAKGRKPPLNQALTQYKKEVENLNTIQKELNQYQTLQQEQQQAQGLLEQVEQQISQLTQKRHQQQQLLDKWPLYEESLQIKQILSNQDDFDLTINQKYQEIKQNQALTTQNLQTATQKMSAAQAAIDETGQWQFYQQHEAVFTDLFEQLQQQEKYQIELNVLTTQHDQIQSQITQIKQILPNNVYQQPILTQTQQQLLSEKLQAQQDLKQQQQNLENQHQQLQNTIQIQTETLNKTTPGATPKLTMILIAVISLIGIIMAGWLTTPVITGVVTIILGAINAGYIYQQTKRLKQQQQIKQENIKQLQKSKTQLASLLAQQQRLETTQQNHQQAIAKLIQDSPDSPQEILRYQNQHHQLQDWQNQQVAFKKQIAQKQTLIDNYLAQFQFAKDWLGQLESPDEALVKIKNYQVQTSQLKQQLQQDQRGYLYYQEQVQALTTKNNELKMLKKQLLKQAEVIDEQQLSDRVMQQQRRQQQKQRLIDIQQQLLVQQEDFQQYNNLQALQSQLADDQQALDQLQLKQKDLQTQCQRLNLQMQRLIDDQTYQEKRQALYQKQAEILDLTKDYLAQQLSAQLIEKTLKAASFQRMPRLLEKAQYNFETLTHGRYPKIVFQQERLQVISQDLVTFDVGELSKGTAEQLYTALRFAFVQVILDVIRLPLIIDDGFVNFDDRRQKAVLTLLKQLSQTNQIIYFTANKNVQEMFNQQHWTVLNQSKE